MGHDHDPHTGAAAHTPPAHTPPAHSAVAHTPPAMTRRCDVAVIGGSAAGLAGALSAPPKTGTDG